MASAGAGCNHVEHVSTQLPYALSTAGLAFVTYLLAAFVRSPYVLIPVGAVLTIGLLLIVKLVQKKKQA